MNNILNEFRLMGRLAADPEFKIISGKNGEMKISNYTLAIDKKLGDGTDFFPVECFGTTAQWACNNLYKGVKVIVEGYLSRNSYKAKDGHTVSETVLTVTNHIFAESKKKSDPADQENSVGHGFLNIPESSETGCDPSMTDVTQKSCTTKEADSPWG